MLSNIAHHSSAKQSSYHPPSDPQGNSPPMDPHQLKEEFLHQFYDSTGTLKPEYKKHGYSDGSEYIGQFLEGRHGRGIYSFKNGDTYLGFWKDDKFNGEGIYLFLNGDVYQGKFVEGRKHGRGTYKYKSGTLYNGEWVKDKKSGFGIHYYLKN